MLVSKTFKFVQNIWESFVDMNRQSSLYDGTQFTLLTMYLCFKHRPVLDGNEEDAIDGESLFMPGVEPEDGEFIDGDDDDELYDEALEEDMD